MNCCQSVKDKAVEICEAVLVDMNEQATSEYYFTYTDGIDECKARIAAIPIPEPRPDALVAMAYRKAAEHARYSMLCPVSGSTEPSDVEQAILSLTPPDAQAALEELVGALDLALLTLANYFEATRHMPELSNLDDNASKIREFARKYGSKL